MISTHDVWVSLCVYFIIPCMLSDTWKTGLKRSLAAFLMATVTNSRWFVKYQLRQDSSPGAGVWGPESNPLAVSTSPTKSHCALFLCFHVYFHWTKSSCWFYKFTYSIESMKCASVGSYSDTQEQPCRKKHILYLSVYIRMTPEASWNWRLTSAEELWNSQPRWDKDSYDMLGQVMYRRKCWWKPSWRIIVTRDDFIEISAWRWAPIWLRFWPRTIFRSSELAETARHRVFHEEFSAAWVFLMWKIKRKNLGNTGRWASKTELFWDSRKTFIALRCHNTDIKS